MPIITIFCIILRGCPIISSTSIFDTCISKCLQTNIFPSIDTYDGELTFQTAPTVEQIALGIFVDLLSARQGKQPQYLSLTFGEASQATPVKL